MFSKSIKWLLSSLAIVVSKVNVASLFEYSFSNEKELKFGKYLSDNGIPIWIRQVLVPGLTDDENDLKKLKDFIDSLNTVKRIELLPYHNMGKFKWEKFCESYPLENVPVPNKEQIQKAKEILQIEN